MFLRALYDAYVFNNFTAPYLHSLNTMSQELEHIMKVNGIQPSEKENKQQSRKRKRRNNNGIHN